MNYTPPVFIEKIQYKNCQQITDPKTGKRVYKTPDGESLPSVTTILSGTKDMTALNEWRKRIGPEKADQITKAAAGVGTGLHANLERFLIGEKRQPGNNPVHIKANAMADVIIENGLKYVDEVWAMEQSLYFPGLYSGTTDLVCVYKGNPCIADYKQTNRLKKPEYVEDYYLQLTAYIMSHNEVYGTDIREGHIFMVTRGDDPMKPGGEIYQQFDLWPNDFNKYQEMWLDRVEKFYTTGLRGLKPLLIG
jgi:genome maintenance exonuclease 1